MTELEYAEMSFRASDSEIYRCVSRDFGTVSDSGRWRGIHVFKSSDGGGTWQELPQKLCLRSLLTSKFLTSWPPEYGDELRVIDGQLVLVYHDREFEYERPILPFGLDRESLWRATYVANRSCWCLKRIRPLDFDGLDRHYRWEDVNRSRP